MKSMLTSWRQRDPLRPVQVPSAGAEREFQGLLGRSKPGPCVFLLSSADEILAGNSRKIVLPTHTALNFGVSPPSNKRSGSAYLACQDCRDLTCIRHAAPPPPTTRFKLIAYEPLHDQECKYATRSKHCPAQEGGRFRNRSRRFGFRCRIPRLRWPAEGSQRGPGPPPKGQHSASALPTLRIQEKAQCNVLINRRNLPPGPGFPRPQARRPLCRI